MPARKLRTRGAGFRHAACFQHAAGVRGPAREGSGTGSAAPCGESPRRPCVRRQHPTADLVHARKVDACSTATRSARSASAGNQRIPAPALLPGLHALALRGRSGAPPPPPFPRNDRTSRVPPLVLSGHARSAQGSLAGRRAARPDRSTQRCGTLLRGAQQGKRRAPRRVGSCSGAPARAQRAAGGAGACRAVLQARRERRCATSRSGRGRVRGAHCTAQSHVERKRPMFSLACSRVLTVWNGVTAYPPPARR